MTAAQVILCAYVTIDDVSVPHITASDVKNRTFTGADVMITAFIADTTG